MAETEEQLIIKTIKGRCRICFACVRECPAKSIKIIGGQASIVYERCIGCGNCVRVCSQDAKQIVSENETLTELLNTTENIAAIIDTSFVAEFVNINYRKVIGALRKVGFKYVTDSSFGADIVALKAKEYLNDSTTNKYLHPFCPAVYYHIEQYHPEMVSSFIPIVSPMIASARVLKKKYGEELKVVYFGPCVVKKAEARTYEVLGAVDLVITFNELQNFFIEQNINLNFVEESEFDGPLGRKGALAVLPTGLVQSIGIYENLLDRKVICANGREDFLEAIKEYKAGVVDAKMIDLWVCNGCVMCAGMTTDEPQFQRRARVIDYVKEILKTRDEELWLKEIETYKDINLKRNFVSLDRRVLTPKPEDIRAILNRIGKFTQRDELNCGACGYETCKEFAKAVFYDLAEDEMCLPNTILKLHKTVRDLANSNKQLESTREALIQSEKLANMGQLSAGIAHELNNPLSVVLMYANLLMETVEKDSQTYEDLQTIVREVDRCRKIVSGLLNFARKNKLVLTPTNICEMISQCMKVTNFPPNITYNIECNTDNPVIDLDKDQIIQVIHNLVNNAIHAMPNGGKLDIIVNSDDTNLKILIKDTGVGIPEQNLKKVFEPFFTTKKVGQGTGLGLAISYGIIKMHQGAIFVSSNVDETKGPTGTTFTIQLPKNLNRNKVELIG